MTNTKPVRSRHQGRIFLEFTSYSNSSSMTKLLQLAITEIEKLPAEEQNANL